MRNLLRTCVLATGLLAAHATLAWAAFTVPNPYSATASVTKIDIRKVFAFGDSYTMPDRHSWHNWIEQIRFDQKNAYGRTEAASLQDYAKGSATAGVYPASINDLAHQVDVWLAVSQGYTDRDLAVIYLGYNDLNHAVRDAGWSNFDLAIAEYKKQVQRIIAREGVGQKRIFVVMPHDWGHTPYHESFDRADLVRQRTQEWNSKVAQMARELSYANVVAVDLFTTFDCVFKQPSSFGFVNVDDSAPSANLPSYLYDYKDLFHFTEHGNTLIRQVVQYYLTRGWDNANLYKDPAVAKQKLVADLQNGRVFNGVTCH
jgi:lysophospholipase L1-like esterase